MSKTSTITKCKCCKGWDTKFGSTLYPHLIRFENGDAGCINKKVENSPYLAVGKEVTYDIIGKVKQDGQEWDKLKEDNNSFGGGGGFASSSGGGSPSVSVDRSIGMRVGMAVNNATQLLVYGKRDDIYEAAKEVYDAAMKLEEYAKEPKAEAIPADELNDVLPPDEEPLLDDDMPF